MNFGVRFRSQIDCYTVVAFLKYEENAIILTPVFSLVELTRGITNPSPRTKKSRVIAKEAPYLPNVKELLQEAFVVVFKIIVRILLIIAKP